MNPPPRPGFATLSWGHVGDFHDMLGEAGARYPGEVWQYTGCRHDLALIGNQTLLGE